MTVEGVFFLALASAIAGFGLTCPQGFLNDPTERMSA
jgi:hypothetical protein